MEITLNNQLTPVNNGRQTDLSYQFNSLLNKKTYPQAQASGEIFSFTPVDTIPQSSMSNVGFVGMLSRAYSQHLKIAIAPQDIWILLTSEVAKEVNQNPEKYRSLFSQSDKKEEISVPSASMTHMPIDVLSAELGKKVLFDSELLFPKFSTNTMESTAVIQAIFCDMAAPFYSYSMFCCGIPAVKLLGDKNDWKMLEYSWLKLIKMFNTPQMEQYGQKAWNILNKITETYDNPEGSVDFWKDIFTQKNVGSGGDLVIDGWITQLFAVKHDFPKITNFTASHGIINYVQKETGREFYAIYGGFDMAEDSDGFNQLTYGSYVFECTKKPNTRK